MKNIMLIYPPGEAYQRGEDRCQVNVNASVSNSLRACNDLGYIAAGLKNSYNVFLKDYPAENADINVLFDDIKSFLPDIVFISTTNGSILYDLKIIKDIKALKPDTVFILKGAIFFNPEPELFNQADFSDVDFLIGGESEFIVPELIDDYYDNKDKIAQIEGICYKSDGKFVINPVKSFNEDLDSLPFPDRSLMKNELYQNPATNRPMATVSTSRGCPSTCIYCLSPLISGRKVRFRSAKSVFDEISECFYKYGINDFFFKSDTFTINKNFVIEVCDLIINSPLCGKINWVANSRVNTLDEEMLEKMKKAGCSLIALGLESGSDESLKLMKKGTSVELNRKCIKLIKKFKIRIFGFYLIGFPWESLKHLKETEKFIFEADTDFIEISVATPFKGSELHDMVFSKLSEDSKILGKDSFKFLTTGTDYLTREELEKFRKRIILKYHLRLSYICRKIFNKNLTFGIFCNYVKYGMRLLKNALTEEKDAR